MEGLVSLGQKITGLDLVQMAVVVTTVGSTRSDSGMRVPGHRTPEQIFSRDELIPNPVIFTFINLNLNFCGSKLMHSRALSRGVLS